MSMLGDCPHKNGVWVEGYGDFDVYFCSDCERHYPVGERTQDGFRLKIKELQAENKKLHQAMRHTGSGKNKGVYLIRDIASGNVKIGITGNIDRRLSMFSTHTPHGVDLLRFFRTTIPRKDEENLHAMFWDRRLNGEWFQLGDNDIERVDKYFQERPLTRQAALFAE